MRSVKSCFFIYHFQQLTEQDLIKLDLMMIVKNMKNTNHNQVLRASITVIAVKQLSAVVLTYA